MKLLTVDSLQQARDKLYQSFENYEMQTALCKIDDALGHILAEDIVSPYNVPGFNRSTVDGYAVVATDTYTASDSIPTFLQHIVDIEMGKMTQKVIKTGECAYVPTGGMIPEGATAVIMKEYCEAFGRDQIAIYEPVAFHENVVLCGDDIQSKQIILNKGTRLTAREIGVISSIGKSQVQVYVPLSLSIISTGDEIIPVGDRYEEGKVFDINTHTLMNRAIENQMIIRRSCLVEDHKQKIKEKLLESMQDSDIVVISGGSSQGNKDMTAEIIEELTLRKVLTHGIALKPGKPTIIGFDPNTRTTIVGLPGHPVAALLVFNLLVIWLQNQLMHLKEGPKLMVTIKENVAAAPGKTTCQLVKLKEVEGRYEAYPIYGKSGLITTLIKADGYVMIDQNKEGLKKDETVQVTLL